VCFEIVFKWHGTDLVQSVQRNETQDVNITDCVIITWSLVTQTTFSPLMTGLSFR